MSPDTLKQALQHFFTRYLPHHRGLCPNTIAAYRQAFKQFIPYLQAQLDHKPFPQIRIQDITPDHILDFLDHIQTQRRVCAATRNARLAALRSFARSLPILSPAYTPLAERLLHLPAKRCHTRPVTYLEPEELDLLFRQIDTESALGFRDAAILRFMYNTGCRISEAVTARIQHLQLQSPAQITLTGKGRKPRICPLWETTVAILRIYLDRQRPRPKPGHGDFIFLSRRGKRFSRQGLWKRIRQHVLRFEAAAPHLKAKAVSPHVIRHTTATHLLQAGVDLSVVSQWLGHQDLETTQRYAKADLRQKRRALERFRKLDANRIFRPEERPDGLLDDKAIIDWLDSLR